MRAASALLAALLLAPAAALLATPASAAEDVDRHATRLNVVAWHPFPDAAPAEERDPFGFAPANLTTDWMRAYYGAYYYPTARFDGLAEEANRADASPADFLDAYRRRVLERLAPGVSPAVTLVLNGSVAGREGALSVLVETAEDLAAERLILRIALVEDDLTFAGANGVLLHRLVARAKLPDVPIAWQDAGGGRRAFAVEADFTVGLGADGLPWRAGHLGFVAWIQKDGDGGRLPAREVVQSATHLFRRDAPTVQASRAVLLEVYTATWCEACVAGDGAVELLLSEMGVPSTLAKRDGLRYFRAPPPATLAAVALLGAPLAWLLWRRLP